MYSGDHDAADRYLRQTIDLRSKQGQSTFPFAAIDWAWLAINKSMQGRHQEAEDILANAPTFSDLQVDPLTLYSRVIPQTLALVRLNAGNIGGAQQVLPATEPPHEDFPDNGSYYQVRGEIRCTAGDHIRGLADLTRSIRSQSEVSSPNHPWVARARAVAGLCALALGNTKEAEAFASEARRAFVAQPNVSPYFKKPLAQLEEQLATNQRQAAEGGSKRARQVKHP